MVRYDEIGYWSEIKLDIISEYASAYSKILSAQRRPRFEHIYIDAFAGAGKHISKHSGQFIPGSPMNALSVHPPFYEYHFIDLDKQKVTSLEDIAGERPDVYIYHGDCNDVMIQRVLPRVTYESYRRALCILDPYGLHLDWNLMYNMGQMKTFDMFLNFPVADMNRNVLWRNPEKVPKEQVERMNRFWGDNSWQGVAYVEPQQRSLFGNADLEKASNEAIAEGFRTRLKDVAGFKHVPRPIAMRNTSGSVVYYLFFASHKPAAQNIVQDIFRKYADRKG